MEEGSHQELLPNSGTGHNNQESFDLEVAHFNILHLGAIPESLLHKAQTQISNPSAEP